MIQHQNTQWIAVSCARQWKHLPEYRQTIKKDGALERRFQPLRIEEPTAEETVAILRALRERMEKHHGVALDDAALRAAVW